MKATLRFVLCRTLAVALLPVVGGSGCHDDGPAALPDDAGAAVDGATRDGSARDGSAWDGSAWDGSAWDGWARDGSARDGSARDGSARDGSSDGAPDAGAPDPPPLSPDAAWRLAPPRDAADRWWLVTPDGRRRFALGVNTVMRDADCDGLLDGWIRRMAPGPRRPSQ
ncbi:MAG: hypothetical protein R3F65_03545 [bacterium]